MTYYSRSHDLGAGSGLDMSQMPYTFNPSDYTHQQNLYCSNSAGPLPPEDFNRPSLPSIANLIGIADGEKGTEMRHAPQPPENQTNTSQDMYPEWPATAQAMQPTVDYSHRASAAVAAAAPTPPMRTDSLTETHSPSTVSTHSSFSGPSYAAGSATYGPDPYRSQYHPLVSHPMRNHPVDTPMMYHPQQPQQPQQMPYSMGGLPIGYYHPGHPGMEYPMYQQKTLPSNFPPTIVGDQIMIPSNPWEQQQYAVNPPSYNSTQERYVCPSCNKPFSRPSSLKIHQNSHTGEKPFLCPRAGCGRAFSVRSNMKRHERGCHAPYK